MPDPETLFETPWLGLYRIGTWDFARRPAAESCVGVLATTAANEIVLVEQFRIPVQQHVIEIPAGLAGDEDEHRGEPLEETARRELLEETGYRAGTLRLLLSSPTSAGMTSEFTHFFHATDLVRESQGGGVGSETITVHTVPLAGLRDWLQARQDSGAAIDSKIHAALWLAGIPCY
jgi:ADP-ribose pyrophosphatase